MRTSRIGTAVSADQLTLELPGLPPLRLVNPAPRRPRRPSPAPAPESSSTTGSVGERVWLVWENDEVLGVYGDPDDAAADCAALRRHAHRDRLTVRYEWMAVPVFTGRRHQAPPADPPRGGGGRWRS